MTSHPSWVAKSAISAANSFGSMQRQRGRGKRGAGSLRNHGQHYQQSEMGRTFSPTFKHVHRLGDGFVRVLSHAALQPTPSSASKLLRIVSAPRNTEYWYYLGPT